MRFNVLGPLEAYGDGHSVAFGGGRQRTLLALLLVHAGEVVSRDRLIDELWSGTPPASGSQSLDVYVSRLRRTLREVGAEEMLATRTPGYVLHVGETDAGVFETLAADGRAALLGGDVEGAARLLREALALWRGRAYLEVADEGWARAEAGRLEELRLSTLEDRIDADLALGRHAALVSELEALVAREPARERQVGQLMLALYRSGRQGDALAAYRTARRASVDELGLEPGPELRRLEAAVLAQDPALDLPRTESTEPVAEAPAALRRHGRLVLAAAAAVAVAAVAIVAVARDGGAPSRTIPADGAGAVDPVSGRVSAAVRVGSAPAAITAGAGRLWVTNSGDGTVTRIDPDGGHVDQTLTVGSTPAGVAAGANAIWVANALDGSVSRIDPRAAQVAQTIRVGRRPVAVTVGEGAVWVADADGDAVIPLDPRSGVPRPPVRLSDSPRGLASGFNSLWVTEPRAHQLVRIDPHNGTTLAEIAVGAGAGPIAVGGSAVWVVNTLDGTLSRIDPTRNAVSSTVPVGGAPAGVAAAREGVWVADAGAGDLVAVDPRSGQVRRRYTVGAAPAAVTLLGRTPWVAAGSPPGAGHRGGTLRVRYSRFRRLDPALPYDVHPGIWRATGDGLIAVVASSGAAELVPDLATSVPRATNGGRTYAFRLRPGLRYSDGVPVRASDFRREFERLYRLHSDIAGLYAALRGTARCTRRPPDCDLSEGVVTDDAAGTVVLQLTRPDPLMLYKIAEPTARPVPRGTPTARTITTPLPSTGPYRVARFVPGRSVLLVRNERFHEWSRAAQPDGYADRIDVRMDDDPNARAAAVLHGQADVALEVSSAHPTRLGVRFASQLRHHTQPDTIYFALNTRRPPFDDARARRALNLAIDRAAIAGGFGGRGLSSPTCQVLPSHFPGHEDYCPWTRGPRDGLWHGADVGRARSLVRASGTSGADVEFIAVRSDPVGRTTAPALATALREIGYRPRVTLLPNPPSFDRRAAGGRWNVLPGDWIADYPHAGQFLDLFLSCSNYRPSDIGRTTNRGGFCDATFDRLVRRAAALQAAKPAAAERLWARADRLAVDQAAWVPLVSNSSVEFLSRRTGHFTVDATSQPQIDQLSVRGN